jgi:hypothetical protein
MAAVMWIPGKPRDGGVFGWGVRFDVGSETTVVEPSQPSAEEKRLTKLQGSIGEEQLKAIQEASGFIEEGVKGGETALDTLGAESVRQAERTKGFEAGRDELAQFTIDQILSGSGATTEQKALIKAATEGALEAGNADIDRAQLQAFETLKEELAPSLGLRPSDSPILDRGGKIAAEGVRQKGQLSSSLRSQAALTELTLPLEEKRVTLGLAQNQEQLLAAREDFAATLRDQAFQNRLRLGQTEGSLRLGLATGVNAGLPATISSLAGTRSQTQVSNPSPASLGLQGLAAGGAVLEGLGAIGVGS